jgi:molecular chaperone DnaK (HSP70)
MTELTDEEIKQMIIYSKNKARETQQIIDLIDVHAAPKQTVSNLENQLKQKEEELKAEHCNGYP